MRAEIFRAVCARIRERVPEIAFAGLWNADTASLPSGAVWPLPAVLVEFEPVVWRQQNRGARRTEIAVRLHIVTRAVPAHGTDDSAMEAALAHFALISRVNAAMQGLRGEGFAGFMLAESDTDHAHGGLIESTERHVTSVQDLSAASPAGPVTPALRTRRGG